MGIASYRRGNKVISRQLDELNVPFEEAPGAAAIRARIDAIEPGAERLFQSTVARPAVGPSGGWLLMNRQDRGYGEYAFPYPSLDAIRRAYAIVLGCAGRDEHGFYWEILAAT